MLPELGSQQLCRLRLLCRVVRGGLLSFAEAVGRRRGEESHLQLGHGKSCKESSGRQWEHGLTS